MKGANLEDITEIVIKLVRIILEFGTSVWNSGLTKEEIRDIDIVLRQSYFSYNNAMEKSNLVKMFVSNL